MHKRIVRYWDPDRETNVSGMQGSQQSPFKYSAVKDVISICRIENLEIICRQVLLAEFAEHFVKRCNPDNSNEGKGMSHSVNTDFLEEVPRESVRIVICSEKRNILECEGEQRPTEFTSQFHIFLNNIDSTIKSGAIFVYPTMLCPRFLNVELCQITCTMDTKLWDL